MSPWRLILAALLVLVIGAPDAGAQEDGPPPAVRDAVDGLMTMLRSTGDASIDQFAAARLATAYREGFTRDSLVRHLKSLRAAAQGHLNGMGVDQGPDGALVLALGDDGGPRIRLVIDAAGKLARLDLVRGGGPAPAIERNDGAPRPARAVAGPPTNRDDARPYHVRALNGTKDLPLDSAVALLDRAHFSPAFIRSTPTEQRRNLVTTIQRAALGAGMIRVTEEAGAFHMTFDGGGDGAVVIFTVETDAPFGISSIRVQPLAPAAAPRETRGAAFAPDELPARIRDAEAAGLAGQVLVRRAGQDVLRTSFGMADRAAGRRSTAETIYCIGSTPIDFTIAAALLLAERGRLDLDAPIGRYLAAVPTDKMMITPRMIIDGRSGLANFHDAGGDADPDLTWIDRGTAVQRILSRPVLYAPGTERRPSHSAFGLLAAIIEVASGQTYQAFLTHEIFMPLGMRRTGFYGEMLGVAESEFATGYGRRSHGDPNIPPRWGPTSWLVMGSGGMVSTLDDLRRFYDGVAGGSLLTKRDAIGHGMSVNGSDRGFLFMRVDNGRGDQVYLLSNTDGERAMAGLRDGLAGLARTAAAATGGASSGR